MDTVETADYAAKITENLGCEVTRGIGANGVAAAMKCGAGKDMIGEEKAILAEQPGSASEDLGQFAAVVPGCLFDIGIMPEDAVSFAPKHNAHYVFNDDAILVGSEMFAQIVRDRLK